LKQLKGVFGVYHRPPRDMLLGTPIPDEPFDAETATPPPVNRPGAEAVFRNQINMAANVLGHQDFEKLFGQRPEDVTFTGLLDSM
jgi:hypothetical protein